MLPLGMPAAHLAAVARPACHRQEWTHRQEWRCHRYPNQTHYSPLTPHSSPLTPPHSPRTLQRSPHSCRIEVSTWLNRSTADKVALTGYSMSAQSSLANSSRTTSCQVSLVSSQC